MLLLHSHTLGYARRLTYAESFIPNSCTRNLQVGTVIMDSPALPDDNSYAITFRAASRGVTLSCGDAYEPGEDLVIHMALPSNHETVFDLSGGAKFYYGHCSPESDYDGKGNNPGVRGISLRTSGSTGTNYIPLNTSSADGAEISVVAAYGNPTQQVYVTEPCTLVGGAAEGGWLQPAGARAQQAERRLRLLLLEGPDADAPRRTPRATRNGGGTRRRHVRRHTCDCGRVCTV